MRTLAAVVFCTAFLPVTSAAAATSVDPLLVQRVNAEPLSLTPLVITYDHQPTAADLSALRMLGINGGMVLDQLPMILTAVNKPQLDGLNRLSGIRSLYANRRFPLMTNESRPFIGLSALRADAEVTASNGGVAVSGKDVGVAYVDTGIDATHLDLLFGRTTVQNVLFPVAEYSVTEWPLPGDFTPMLAVENQPLTDVEGGHGTFGAAVTAGGGDHSGAFYGGVAPGARLIGLVAGNDVGLTTFAIVQAYNYALANQFRYNIRVCNNSFGTVLADYPYDPFDPINTATREMHDRNIVVVFAAGNGIQPQPGAASVGDVPGAINPFSVAPWVISVGAGEKQGLGTPATFSSRGEDDGIGSDVAGQPADPDAPPNLRPDLIGSGLDIKSARSKGPGVTNVAGSLPIFVGANDLTTIAPAFLPFYTTSQGTSFSTPQVSGVVALMLEANPSLSPDEVVTILRETATPMPYTERVVGAGYVDARNAVRRAMALSMVEHPANLFPGPQPEIVDPKDDQLGTRAQDIWTGDFAYDADTDQIVYTLTLADLSRLTPNMRWTMRSAFGAVTVFVTAAINETGAATFSYGRITVLPSGTQNQQTLGPADAGAIQGSQIIVRLSLTKVNAAVGFDVLFTVSKSTQALAQILIGTSVSGGLLLASDVANGSDFQVGERPPPGARVEPSAGLVTSEAGGEAQFTIVLESPPAADVTIALSSSDAGEGTVSPASLTFTPADWNVAQAVVVRGVDDAVADGEVAYQVTTAPASSDDPAYNGLDAPDVSVINTDNDAAGITVSPTAGLATTEAGGTASFSVVLNSEPTAEVSIAFSSSDQTEGEPSPGSLTFTAADWNVARTIIVIGVDDAVADGDVAYTVSTGPASSADPGYAGRDAADVSLTNLDDDTAGFAVSADATLVTTEAGGSAQFTVALTSQPLAQVVLSLSSSDPSEGSVSPSSLTFTADNWNAAQAVTVSGVDDAEDDGDMAYAVLLGPATSSDPGYDGRDPADPAALNMDDDVAGPAPSCTKFHERFPGTLAAGDSMEVEFDLRCMPLKAKLNAHPGNASLTLELLDPEGNVVASTEAKSGLTETALPAGRYRYRVTSAATEAVEFVLKSAQGE